MPSSSSQIGKNLKRSRIAIAFACTVGSAVALLACVGDVATPAVDASTPEDSSKPDTGVTADTGADGGADVTPGSDANALCSDPVVGFTIPVPATASNASIAPQTGGPLLGGDYKMTGMGLSTSICFPAPCAYQPKSGAAIGGLRVTSLGGGSYVVERRVEVQQKGKIVVVDRFTATFDQTNRKLAIARVCVGAGGATGDAGTNWNTTVEVVDGGATGRVFVELPDVPIEQVFPDGGAGPAATLTATFTKQ
ncbi:hypothetical protein BH09MYX1_BH09MYX1_39830 [soil metagenome]